MKKESNLWLLVSQEIKKLELPKPVKIEIRPYSLIYTHCERKENSYFVQI